MSTLGVANVTKFSFPNENHFVTSSQHRVSGQQVWRCFKHWIYERALCGECYIAHETLMPCGHLAKDISVKRLASSIVAMSESLFLECWWPILSIHDKTNVCTEAFIGSSAPCLLTQNFTTNAIQSWWKCKKQETSTRHQVQCSPPVMGEGLLVNQKKELAITCKC